MTFIAEHKNELLEKGFTILSSIYSEKEINAISDAILDAESTNETFRKSADLFAIRQFLQEVPAAKALVLNENLKSLINTYFGTDYFVVKSIYFDKPASSNWFVAYHQDLTISVDIKGEIDGFGPWTVKQNQFAVQPPVAYLETNFTLRIHLDNTDENNGALYVIPGSHLKGIYRPETIDWTVEKETICAVPCGGVMIMNPLLLHSSRKTTNDQQRRVIHIEFSASELPKPLQWSERISLIETQL